MLCGRLRLVSLAACCLIIRAAPQEVPPVVERQIQPEWGPDLEKDYVVDHAKVALNHRRKRRSIFSLDDVRVAR